MSGRPNTQTRDITELKKVQQKSLQSELAIDIIEAMADGVVIVGMDGKVTFINKAFEKMLGYNGNEIIGISAVELPTYRSSKDKKRARQALRMVIEKGSAEPVDMIALTKDEREIPISFTASVIKDAQGDPRILIAVIRDITERKQAEDALRRSEEYFRALMDNSLDAVTIMSEDGTICYESPSYERLLGFKPEERVGSNLFERIHPDDMAKVAELFAAFLKNRGGTIHAEVRAQHKDGSWRFIEATGSNLLDNPVVKGIVINLRDITERKGMEEGLRDSEQRFRAIFDNAVDGIVLADLDDRKFYTCNRMFSQMLGYSVGEIKKLGVMDIHPEKDLPYVTQQFEKQVVKEFTLAEDIPVKRKDGGIFYADVNSSLITLSGKSYLMGIFRDITERKRMEEELHRLSGAVKMSNDSIVISDLEGRIIEANEATLKMHGMKNKVDFIGREALEIIAPEDRETAAEKVANALAAMEVKYVEYHALKNDGSKFLVEASVSVMKDKNGKPTGYIAVARDITERRRVEEALRESEERYRLLVDNASEAIVVIQDGMFKFFNNRAVELLGYSREELASKPFIELIHPDDQRMLMERYLERLKGGNPLSLYSFKVINKAGNVRWGDVNAVMINWEGRPATLNFLTDITERKTAEEEKQKMEEQLKLAGRLAAVGELAAGVAHELNNPLAIIQMYSGVSKERGDLDDTAKKDLLVIYEQAKRASKITHNLLSFARKHEPEKNMVPVNEIIEKTLEIYSHQMSINNIELSEELQPDLPMTMADENQMQQVFMNIIINAEQAMLEAHGRGKLNIKTETTEGTIEISFTDDGPGIAEGHLERLFDPFFTTKEVGKGTGLGLSICYGIVQAHGGRIYAISKMGEGATFVIEIPITSEYQKVSGIEKLSNLPGE